MKKMMIRSRRAIVRLGGWLKKKIPVFLFVGGWVAITAGIVHTWRGWAISGGSYLLLRLVVWAFTEAARERKQESRERH
jgi:hypothetical protein